MSFTKDQILEKSNHPTHLANTHHHSNNLHSLSSPTNIESALQLYYEDRKKNCGSRVN